MSKNLLIIEPHGDDFALSAYYWYREMVGRWRGGTVRLWNATNANHGFWPKQNPEGTGIMFGGWELPTRQWKSRAKSHPFFHRGYESKSGKLARDISIQYLGTESMRLNQEPDTRRSATTRFAKHPEEAVEFLRRSITAQQHRSRFTSMLSIAMSEMGKPDVLVCLGTRHPDHVVIRDTIMGHRHLFDGIYLYHDHPYADAKYGQLWINAVLEDYPAIETEVITVPYTTRDSLMKMYYSKEWFQLGVTQTYPDIVHRVQ